MLLQVGDRNELPEQILKAGVAMLYFWHETCTSCARLGPVLDELSEKMGDKLVLAKINIDKSPELAKKYKIRSLPSMILLHKGEKDRKIIGFKSLPELESMLDS